MKIQILWRAAFALVALGAIGQCAFAQQNPTRKIRVLTSLGDWKTQAWYQDKWMQGKGEKLFRGRFIAREVERAAPGRFEFVDITNYEAQQYGETALFSQFDVVMLGDVVGWSLPPRFHQGLKGFVENGGGLLYAASYKWGTATLDDTPFEEILPARFGVNNRTEDWKGAKTELDEKDFKPVASAPDHPITRELNWAAIPTLNRAFHINPKTDAQILLRTPLGAPILAVRDVGAGRTAISSSINANDELSEKVGEWPDFGKYYAQLFTHLGAKSRRQPTPALREATAQFTVSVDATKPAAMPASTANLRGTSVAAVRGDMTKLFGIHASHDDPGLMPYNAATIQNFEAMNLRGAFSRFSPHQLENQNDNADPNTFNWAAFNFKNTDVELANMKKQGLEPLLLVGDYGYGRPEWLWKESNSTWHDPSPAAIAEAAEYAAAAVEHINGGKGGDPNYKLNVRFVEIANEPDLKGSTIPGFARLFKGIAARIHRDYPGVQVGTFGGYEVPYLPQFLEAVNPEMDWISRHPYGWTGEMLMAQQDEITLEMKRRGLREIPFIITEWDFWIQGRAKFDYMMRRNFEAVKRPNLLGTLHYRLGQYREPVYLFGVLWTGSEREKGAGERGTPMHDAFDAFYLWRNFRGQRVGATVQSETPGAAPLLENHLLADAAVNGEVVNAVIYHDWANAGSGVVNAQSGVRYSKARVRLNLNLPPSSQARTLTIQRATGEGFENVGAPIAVRAGQTRVETTLEIAPLTGYSVTVAPPNRGEVVPVVQTVAAPVVAR